MNVRRSFSDIPHGALEDRCVDLQLNGRRILLGREKTCFYFSGKGASVRLIIVMQIEHCLPKSLKRPSYPSSRKMKCLPLCTTVLVYLQHRPFAALTFLGDNGATSIAYLSFVKKHQGPRSHVGSRRCSHTRTFPVSVHQVPQCIKPSPITRYFIRLDLTFAVPPSTKAQWFDFSS